jgi:putative membrane protein
MLRRFLLRLLVLAGIIALVAWLVPGIDVNGGFLWLVWVAFLWSVINAFVGPILRLLSLPVIVFTLGLFLIVINAALVAITAWLSDHLDVDSFGAAVLGGLLIGLFSWLAEVVLPMRRQPANR